MLNYMEYKNKHQGKPCIIIGSGTSVADIPNHLIQRAHKEGCIIIAVNAGILKYNADYFFTDDKTVRNWSYYDYAVKYNTKMVIHDRFAKDNERNNNQFIIYTTTNVLKICDTIVQTKTSVVGAISFAKWMGCERIILLGCDCYTKGYKKYFYQMEKGIRQLYKGQKSQPVIVDDETKLKNMIHAWNEFQNENQDLDIINCSMKSKIECFKKQPFEELIFEMYPHGTACWEK